MISRHSDGNIDIIHGSRLVASRDQYGNWSCYATQQNSVLLNEVASAEREYQVKRSNERCED